MRSKVFVRQIKMAEVQFIFGAHKTNNISSLTPDDKRERNRRYTDCNYFHCRQKCWLLYAYILLKTMAEICRYFTSFAYWVSYEK